MLRKLATARFAAELAAWVVPLVLYALVVAPLAVEKKELINSDAVSYVNRARALAGGNFIGSVSDYWSPVLSWSITPLFWLKMDGLYAARLACCVWGGLFLLAFAWFVKVITALPAMGRMLVGCAMALGVAPVAVRQITPDILMATCLLAYFAIAGGGDLLRSRKRQIATGLAGGFCYLAKAYALPFVVVHLPVVVAMRWWAGRKGLRPDSLDSQDPHPDPLHAQDPHPDPLPEYREREGHREREKARRALGAWGVAMAGVAAVAGLWIGVLSLKYGKLTISGSAGRAHDAALAKQAGTKLGAKDAPEEGEPQPHLGGQQWNVIRANVSALWDYLHQFDQISRKSLGLSQKAEDDKPAIHFSVLGLFVAAAALAGFPRLRTGRWQIAFLLASAAIFCAGYMFVWFKIRYIISLVAPLLLILCAKLATEWRGPTARQGQERPPIAIKTLLLLLVCLSFGAQAIDDIRQVKSRKSSILYRTLATKIDRAGFKGGLASTERISGSLVAFFSDRGLVRWPDADDPAAVEAKLRSDGVGVVLLWRTQRQLARERAATRAASQPATLPQRDGDDEGDEEETPTTQRTAYDVATAMVSRPGWRCPLVHEGSTWRVQMWLPPWQPELPTTRPAAPKRGRPASGTARPPG